MPAPTSPSYIYRAECKRVIDADTFVARTEVGFKVSIDVTVRLHGVNAPEHNKPGGKEATEWLERTLVPDGKPVPLLLQSYKDAMSFARWVCDCWTVKPEASVAEALIAAGHGKAFDPRVDKWER